MHDDDVTSALDAALALLRCPVCGTALRRVDGALRCEQGHAFDVARQGYVTLLRGAHRHRGDTAAMVTARDTFLTAGHYATIAAAVEAAVERHAPPGAVLDLAAGTGWYAAQVLDTAPSRTAVAVDVSTPALKRAARAHPRLAAIGADAWGELPVSDGSFAAVLSVFGPRTAGEIARVLAPDGLVVAVTPTPRHLAEIVGPLGMLDVGEDKVTRLRDAFVGFEPLATRRVERVLTLGHAPLAALVGMGPTGHHLEPAAIAGRVEALPPTVDVTLSVDVSTFRNRASGSQASRGQVFRGQG